MDAEPETHARSTTDAVPERFVPEQMRGQLVAAEHIARYRWAASFCGGRRALDAGCGAGYGSEVINQAGAESVVAVDTSEAALELARSAVTDGVTCEIGDVSALRHPNDSFDLVVCFEVIEHVEDRDQVLDELRRVLRPDGMLLLSSPNRVRYMPGNPHHRHEYTRPELEDALDKRFESVRIISQHVMLASAITWSAAPLFDDAQTLRASEPERDDEIYLLAMAGRELPPDPGPIVALGAFAEPRRWLEYIDGQRAHIEAQARHLRDLEGRDTDRRAALERLALAEQELASSRSARQQLEEARKDLDALYEREGAQNAERLRELEHLRAQLAAVRASRTWRMTAPLRRIRS